MSPCVDDDTSQSALTASVADPFRVFGLTLDGGVGVAGVGDGLLGLLGGQGRAAHGCARPARINRSSNGASSGLGEALAKDLSRRGATLVLASRRVERLNTVADACVDCSPHAKKPAVLALDLCDDAASLGRKAAEAEANLGEMHVDVLICCAGVAQRSAAAQTSAEEHARIMSQFEGHVALTRALLPPMLARGAGSIAVVSSVQGFFGQPYRSSYAAAKAALVGYYDSLRAEVAQQGIKVTVIAPGYIATDHAASAVGGDGALDDNAKSGMAPDELARRVADAVEAGEAQLVPAPIYAQAAMLFRAIWPSGFFGYMERKARKG